MTALARFLLIAVVGGVVFSNSLGNPMLLDDFETIVENQQIRHLDRLDVLMPERELPVAGRPLSNVTFAMNYVTAGEAVGAYHLTNLALHLLCAMTALLLIEQVLQLPKVPVWLRAHAAPIALITALIWVVHPLNSEVVNYLTQRTESLMAAFYLLAVYGAVRAINSSDRRWPILATVACAVGALCKESIATAPLAIVAMDRLLIYSSWRDAWRRRRVLYAGLAFCWVVLAALQSTSPRPTSTGFSTGISVWTYLLNQAQMIGQYLRLTVWPQDLVVLYGRPLPLTLGQVLPQGLLILALLGATVVACRRRPAIGVVGVWFFLTLAPTSSILPIATEVGAERRMYLPLLAIILLAVCLLWKLVHHAHLRVATVSILVLALGVTTFARNREYANPLHLAEITLARWPTGMTRQLVGEELLKVGRKDEALQHLRAAAPDTPRVHFTIGLELYNEGQLDEAAREFQTFVRLEPDHLLVPNAQALAARAHARQQQWGDAVQAAQAALAKTPDNPDARVVMAEAHLRQSQFADAISDYRRYLALRPSDVDATTNLGIALLTTGQVGDGIATFRRAVSIDPNNWQTRRNLALALLDAGQPAESVAEARRAVALRPDDAVGHALLGQGLAGIGQVNAAIAELERALQLDPTDADARRHLAQLRGR